MPEPTIDPDEQMLTAAEVCTRLRIGKTTFYKLIRTEQLEARNVNPAAPGRRPVGQKGPRPSIRVPKSSVDAFLERARMSASA